MLYFESQTAPHVISQDASHIKDKKIDVIFFGANNGRRQEKLNIIQEMYKDTPTKYSFHTGTHGAELKVILLETKIGLNMHYYGGRTILEVHRVSDMILNGLIVLSETSDDKYIDNQYKDIVIFFNTTNLADKVKEVISWSPEKFVKETSSRFELYKNMGGSFTDKFIASKTVLLSM